MKISQEHKKRIAAAALLYEQPEDEILEIVIEKGLNVLATEKHLENVYNTDILQLMMGVKARIFEILWDNGYRTVADVIDKDLTHLKGIGPAINDLIQERIQLLLNGERID